MNRMINKNRLRNTALYKENNLYTSNKYSYSYNKPIKNMNKLVN